ncbi:wax ester/triacylglycerol synthase family O-acyltransferase [Nocardia jiangsuensis]|uniref:Diacylglycerol O-acyltransferase n=1 Tax=Nocardia jiangsuensis TaxID=1691563 RepID=A0ABV8DNY4_9NOCA
MSTLTPLDSVFLLLEDVDQRVGTGIGVVATIEGAPPSRAEFADQVAARIRAHPRLRQRLHRTLADLVAPQWVPDEQFDLDHHLRRHALPAPGDRASLEELVAAVAAERIDRDHPLWRCHVVECPGSAQWVLILLAHHSMVDGLSGVELLRSFCDDPPAVEHRPVQAAGIAPFRLLRDALRLPRTAVGAVAHALPVLLPVLGPGSGTSLNGRIGRQRRYRAVRVPLADVRDIGAAFDATVNDVALAAVAAGLGALLDERGERADRVRILAPVSVRGTGEDLGNRVSVMLPRLPVGTAPAVEQLAWIRGETRAHKASGEVGGVGSLIRWTERLPFAAVAPAARLLCRYPQRGVAGLVTDVFGPAGTLRFAGRTVLDIVAVPPIAMRLRVGVAVLSYGGTLSFGVLADHDSVPDLDVLADNIEAAIGHLRSAAAWAPRRMEQPVPLPATEPARADAGARP